VRLPRRRRDSGRLPTGRLCTSGSTVVPPGAHWRRKVGKRRRRRNEGQGGRKEGERAHWPGDPARRRGPRGLGTATGRAPQYGAPIFAPRTGTCPTVETLKALLSFLQRLKGCMPSCTPPVHQHIHIRYTQLGAMICCTLSGSTGDRGGRRIERAAWMAHQQGQDIPTCRAGSRRGGPLSSNVGENDSEHQVNIHGRCLCHNGSHRGGGRRRRAEWDKGHETRTAFHRKSKKYYTQLIYTHIDCAGGFEKHPTKKLLRIDNREAIRTGPVLPARGTPPYLEIRCSSRARAGRKLNSHRKWHS